MAQEHDTHGQGFSAVGSWATAPAGSGAGGRVDRVGVTAQAAPEQLDGTP